MRFQYETHPDGRFIFNGHVRNGEVSFERDSETLAMLKEPNPDQLASVMLRSLSLIFRSTEPDTAAVDYTSLGYAYARAVRAKMAVHANPVVDLAEITEKAVAIERLEKLERLVMKFWFKGGK